MDIRESPTIQPFNRTSENVRKWMEPMYEKNNMKMNQAKTRENECQLSVVGEE